MLSKLCECGCGQYTELASRTNTKRGWKKGEPLHFINGHNNGHERMSNTKVEKHCRECGTSFKVWPCFSEQMYCSNACADKHRNAHRTAPEGHVRKTSGGYLQIKDSEHSYADSKGYVMYHRWLLEQYYHIIITPDYDVHHIDKDKTNNDLSNLAILTHSEHMRIHAKERKIWELSPR